MTDKNLGHATAYGYAKSKGYTGTEEEFAELMASYAEVATDARGYAEQAEQSASNAQASASNAQASATSASISASSASASAQTASTKASEASDSATSASESASTAVSAKDDAVTAKEQAETAKADAETAAEEAQESAQTVANKADKDGTYPDMTVGGVMSSDGSTDSTPYLYRESGGGVEVGSVEEDSIVGGTVAFNQLVQNGNFADASGWSSTQGTFSVSGNKATVTVSSPVASNNLWRNIGVGKASHKYLLSACLTASKASKAAIRYNNVETARIDIPANAKTLIGGVINYGTTDSVLNVVIYYNLNTALSAGDTCVVESVMAIDLTQMFGSTIADYIYSLEQSSTGAGVAFFRKLFPKDYYEYNTGELMSVEGVSAHVMRDADDNIIGNYPLDSSLTLRGIPKLSDGLYFDGDTYEADGTVTRKYGIRVFDGSETWTARGVQGSYVCQDKSFVALNAQTQTTNKNLISNTYPSETWGGSQSTDKVVSLYFYQGFHIHDTSFADVTALKEYLSQHPITVVYELATPTTESAEPYESIQKVSKYGTEEYVSTSIVPVGHVTKYPTDIVAKVNGLPSDFSTLIAPTESGFKASKAYSVNQFIIVNNQLYRATSAIANGATITVGTNVTATTVADILTSLLNA